jgi:sirohydrochlorin cobaltochelatase
VPALFTHTTLVLLGHGSTKNDGSEKPVYQHVAELRRRGLFADVREAFWKQEPMIAGVLEAVRTPRAIIVPLFISEGYFTEEAIPEALGFKTAAEINWSRVKHIGGREIHYTRPVGTHPRMTEVLLHRAAEVVAKYPFPSQPKPADTSLFVAGHGTERNTQSRRAIEQQVESIRARNLFAEVQPCFMEEAPRIADIPQLAVTKKVVMVPFFISDGLHVTEDIPVLLGEPEAIVQKRLAAGQPTWRNPTERNGKLIWYAPAVGSDPGMAEVILELAKA